jgi:hypothetical protein
MTGAEKLRGELLFPAKKTVFQREKNLSRLAFPHQA